MTDTRQILAGAVHPAMGLAGAIASRTGVLGGGMRLGEHLGKTLSHHQVVQPVNQPRTANRPMLDIGKAVLSATGGHPRIPFQALRRTGLKTSPASPFDRRGIAREGNNLKHQVSQVSIKSQ